MTPAIDLRAMLLKDFGVDLPISGGTGNSIDAPIVVHYREPNDYVAVEYAVLQFIGIGRGIEWKLLQARLVDHEGRRLEQMKIETRWQTATEAITQVENYYFDITECFGR